jgi:hypothetical protein
VVGGSKKEFGTVLIDSTDQPIIWTGVHKPDFSIIAIEHHCLIDSSVINSTIAKEHESNKLVPHFSLVAIDSLTVPETRSVLK